jgi:hypothetical protein
MGKDKKPGMLFCILVGEREHEHGQIGLWVYGNTVIVGHHQIKILPLENGEAEDGGILENQGAC